MSDYKRIVEQFNNQLKKRGFPQEDIINAFRKAEDGKIDILNDLYKTFSYWSSIYRTEYGELDELKDYIVPKKVINFYKHTEPGELPCLDGYVYLLSLDDIKRENSELSPSAYLIKYGLLTIATTVGGNAICLDLNEVSNGEPRVVYVDGSWISFNEDKRKVEYLFNIPDESIDDGWLGLDIIKNYIPEIEKGFSIFLDRLSISGYDNMEMFYNKI